MRHLSLPSIALAGLLFASGIASSVAQTAADDPTTHHPDAAPPTESQGDTPGAGMPREMMGMMTPEMMQMMHRMMGQGGPGMMGQGGPGMMGQGGMPGMGQGGPGMMGQGGMPGMGQGGPGMMGMMRQGTMDDTGLLYGLPTEQQPELTPEKVRRWLQQRLARHGNPRLELGEITADDDSITAEIVTVDGSLVQKLAFNRYPGLVRQVIE